MKVWDLGKIKDLRWDLGPTELFMHGPVEVRSKKDYENLNEQLKKRAGHFLVIDVYNLSARLLLYHSSEDGSTEFVDTIEGIPEEVLIDAIEKQGGAINWSGWYRLTPDLINFIRKEAGM